MSAVLTKEEISTNAATQPRAALKDCLFLALVVLVSSILYLSQLGFSSDDWIFLSLLSLPEDQSLPGLYQALYEGDVVIRQRPVQMLYLVLFYWLFGLQPLFYHLANTVALLASGILFYLVIRMFGQGRLIALAISFVYLLLPHYATDRFWVAAHQATFSILFFFLSLYADLRAVRAYPTNLLRWKLLSTGSLVLSGLSYEVALPLFLLGPLLIWYGPPWRARQEVHGQSGRPRFFSLFAPNLLALFLVVGFKVMVTVRANVEVGFLTHLVSLFAGAFRVNFVTYGVGLPYIVGWILFHQPSWPVLVVSLLLGLLAFGYLFRLGEGAGNELSQKKNWPAFLLLGLLVFSAGYAIFAFNQDIWFTSASLGNRVAIAAAIGVAITFVGLSGWISSLLPKRWGQRLFYASISLLGVTGFLIVNTLASFWISAYAGQQNILQEIRENAPALPSGSMLILDGVCLEKGGAYLYTGKRDMTATLWLAYEDQSLGATVISSSPEVGEQGLSILTYKRNDFYPYGEDLLIYNVPEKRLYPLANANMARQYFERSGFVPEWDCPSGFAWAWNDQ